MLLDASEAGRPRGDTNIHGRAPEPKSHHSGVPGSSTFSQFRRRKVRGDTSYLGATRAEETVHRVCERNSTVVSFAYIIGSQA